MPESSPVVFDDRYGFAPVSKRFIRRMLVWNIEVVTKKIFQHHCSSLAGELIGKRNGSLGRCRRNKWRV
ncbi:hypothetical protein HanRHA438_Chr10g0446951 [Helianthus annuus]|uniref:Uncharacterized protein n=1 Tax=Helianthus annuus TaxID=4232 RepID=A0A9K3HWP8_HELAN|nr:hypothetical protein HanXRQr2_Chr10g0434721 [Helianthus annuus]KAJ0521260.1 hypothetical protein HanIR_Chr10g0468821 [Helianthus annuus]KAJ0879057.1 hypothetical protein HanRHA438_Chr10g0446951 [Helianthus annuus]KAJ0883313.1 hypothetical protein HanPSC8_Chr10g0420041 [Helianthus annuus]